CWLAAKKAKKIITISEFSKNELMKFYKLPESRIMVNPWGLNKKLLSMDWQAEKIQAVREKYGLKSQYLISWGQAFARRHVKEAILAFEKIAPCFGNLQYLVACADKYNPPILEDLITRVNNKLGRKAIIYRNYIENQDELFYLIKAASLAIYISSSEAMGLPPLEALACGVPPLVAENELNREIYGQNAFFVRDLENIDEIAAKISDGISDQKQRENIFANAGQVINKFSWENNANKFIKILKEAF
ncbi:MAG: hypothetical protein A2174_02680, partial [Candidatus Portnoybacteria bacterium RBG_13_41_18]